MCQSLNYSQSFMIKKITEKKRIQIVAVIKFYRSEIYIKHLQIVDLLQNYLQMFFFVL